MQLRSSMSMRLGRRITSIIRIDMVGISVMALAMLMLMVIVRMDEHMQAMPRIVSNVQDMEKSVTSMAGNMHTISEHLGVMKQNIQQLSVSVASMDSTFVTMDDAVIGIGQQVSRSAGQQVSRSIPCRRR